MRVSKPPQERRAELLAAARQLFDQKGVQQTRVADIVRQVGVAQGVFYYYFPSKDAVVQAVVQQVKAETANACRAVLEDDSLPFCQKLSAIIGQFLKLVDQFLGDEETSLASLWNLEGRRDNLAVQTAGQLMDSLQQLVLAGAREGDIPVPYPWETAQVLVFGLFRLAETQLPTREVIDRMAEQALGLKPGCLQPPKAKRAPVGAE